MNLGSQFFRFCYKTRAGAREFDLNIGKKAASAPGQRKTPRRFKDNEVPHMFSLTKDMSGLYMSSTIQLHVRPRTQLFDGGSAFRILFDRQHIPSAGSTS